MNLTECHHIVFGKPGALLSKCLKFIVTLKVGGHIQETKCEAAAAISFDWLKLGSQPQDLKLVTCHLHH